MLFNVNSDSELFILADRAIESGCTATKYYSFPTDKYQLTAHHLLVIGSISLNTSYWAAAHQAPSS
jgi:hypothetical protein